MEIKADLVLLDDSDAREKARIYNLRITGTIGILLQAKSDGKIASLKNVLEKLKRTGFWIDDKLTQKLLKVTEKI